MLDVDQQALVEQSTKNLNLFLQKEQRSLVTFTEDSQLIYLPDENLERFRLEPKTGTLYLPLAAFLENDLDELQILWHIYFELSLYPDWKKEPGKYLYREKSWQKEIDHMTIYFLNRIKREGLEQDEAYQPDIISAYIKREILDFLARTDEYTAFIRVLQLNPVYRQPENFRKIVYYFSKVHKTKENLEALADYQLFSRSFMMDELYKSVPEIKDLENILPKLEILSKPFYEFMRTQIVNLINRGEGISKRDPFIRSFIYPVFEQLWKNEIDRTEFSKSTGEQEKIAGGEGEALKKSKEQKDTLESSEQQKKKVLKEMLEQQEKMNASVKESLRLKSDLSEYGISQTDQQLFMYYSNKMRPQREQMQRFWLKLIGDAKKEVSVKKQQQTKGKLDVQSLIHVYPDFVEAEKKGSYKNLPIFSRYMLETQANVLPEKVEISFVIDNSGSMNPEKIEAARKALAVTLLSIDDFNAYLGINSQKLNQNVEVITETWFFGSNYYKVKSFDDENMREKEKSGIIRSIVELDATDGSTDDASCLKDISKSISKAQQQELKRGKQIKIVFEITDGAASFPGATKEAVQELLGKEVEVYAFQIGKNSDMDRRVFNFVWNEGFKEPRGIIIGEEIEKLPTELLSAVAKNMQSIFSRNI